MNGFLGIDDTTWWFIGAAVGLIITAIGLGGPRRRK